MEEKEIEEKNKENNNDKKKKNNKPATIAGASIVVISIIAVAAILLLGNNKTSKEKIKSDKVNYTKYTMKGNSLDDFDIGFLKLENEEVNKVYSPLSIKYALSMLYDAAEGDSKKQISNILGEYKYKKYTNSANLSLANAMFIRNRFKDQVKNKYVENVTKKYGAEVIFDDFATPDAINNWASNKTFGLVGNLLDSVDDDEFVLVNALAIDMEWVNTLKPEKSYYVSFKNENYHAPGVSPYKGNGYDTVKFNGSSEDSSAARTVSIINKYDIVKTLGEENIRKEVGDKYEAWLAKEECGPRSSFPTVDEYLNEYIKDIDSNYKHVSSSTDYYFYTDDNTKVFAKDLKEYDGTTLQYIGIMPTNENLKEYINNLDSKKAVDLISSLKKIELGNFEEGKITEIEGSIPIFNYDYNLNLKEDLIKLGVKDVFKLPEANIKGLTDTPDMYIEKAVHKAKIDFTNEGIKAGAATALGGGMGAAGCSFYHLYDVPVEKIDLTFDKPYIYFIIDKSTKEVWFTGTVYEPTKYERPSFAGY